MKKVLFILPLLVFFLASSFGPTQEGGEVKPLKSAEFKAKIDSGKYILIDVRKAEEFNEGHVKGAINVDYFADDFPAQMMSHSKKGTMILYCQGGGLSQRTADKLSQNGIDLVYYLNGGLNAYQVAGYKLTK